MRGRSRLIALNDEVVAQNDSFELAQVMLPDDVIMVLLLRDVTTTPARAQRRRLTQIRCW